MRDSLSEQRRIVGYLDGLAGQVAALARLQSESHLRLERSAGLRRTSLDARLPSVLDKAFTGK